MRGPLRFVCLTLVVVGAFAYAVAGSDVQSKRVTLDLKDCALDDAFRQLFKDTDQSFVLDPAVDGERRITVSLKNVPFDQAFRVILETHDLKYKRDDGVWRISPRSDVVTIGGRRVPVVGAMQVESALAAAEAQEAATKTALEALQLEGLKDRRMLETFTFGYDQPPSSGGGATKFVDLELKDVPFAEAIARVSKESGLDIVVHKAVPKELKVTAKVYMVPGEWLLRTLVDQANLRIQEEAIVEEKETARERIIFRRPKRYHIVPKAEVRVSGPGVAEADAGVILHVGDHRGKPRGVTTLRFK